MELDELAKKVEAVLFAAGRKVGLEELKELCKEEDLGRLKEAAAAVKGKLDEEDSPLLLTEEADGYKLTVREKFLPMVQNIIPETELGRSVLETLAVIAWKSPVLQSEVIQIRTSNAYEHISQLVDMGFISKIPQGRSYLLKTTQKFAEYFDVPDKEKIKELFKEAEEKYGQVPVIPAEGEEVEEGEEGLHLGNLPVYSEEEPEEEEKEEAETEEEKAEAEEEAEKEEAEMKEEEEGEPEQPTEEVFEEPEEAPEEESALEAFEEAEKEEPEEEAPAEEEQPEEEEPEPEEEQPQGEEEQSQEEAPAEEIKEEIRKLPEALEKELETDQPDFLHPKEDIEQIEEEVEESKEIQEEEKEIEEEEKEESKEDIEVPKAKPEKGQ